MKTNRSNFMKYFNLQNKHSKILKYYYENQNNKEQMYGNEYSWFNRADP